MVLCFAEHIDAFVVFVNSLNPDVAQLIEDAEGVLKAPNVRGDIHFVL